MGLPGSAPRVASRIPSIVAVANAAPAAPPHRVVARWSVQVGAFASEAAAREAAAAARRATDDGDVRVESATVHGRTTWRALLTGLSQSVAHQACAALLRHRMPCTPLRPERGQLASK
jgi:hypothetical protein